jgi:hypothetical protein
MCCRRRLPAPAANQSHGAVHRSYRESPRTRHRARSRRSSCRHAGHPRSTTQHRKRRPRGQRCTTVRQFLIAGHPQRPRSPRERARRIRICRRWCVVPVRVVNPRRLERPSARILASHTDACYPSGAKAPGSPSSSPALPAPARAAGRPPRSCCRSAASPVSLHRASKRPTS